MLDRTTGEFLLGTPYAKQTWAKGSTPKGRPIVLPNMEPSEEGTLVYPSLQGSTNWSSPSYSPLTGLLYVPVREMGSIYYKTPVEYERGTYFTGGSEKRLDEEAWGAVRALDVKTGQAAWDFKLPSPPWAGVHGHRRRPRLRRIERRQLLRARREDRQAAVAVPDRGAGALEPSELSRRRPSVRLGVVRPRLVRLRPATGGFANGRSLALCRRSHRVPGLPPPRTAQQPHIAAA